MARLPSALDLNPVGYRAVQQSVNVPVADYAGAANAVARGLSDVGQAAADYAKRQEDALKMQERFDTRVSLLHADEQFYNETKDLDQLDPGYIQKKQDAYKRIYGDALKSVKHPENQQYFDAATYEGYVNLGIKSDGEQHAAYGKKAEIDTADLVDDLLKKSASGQFKGDPNQELQRILQENRYLSDVQRAELGQKFGSYIDKGLVYADTDKIVSAAESAVGKTPTDAGFWAARYAGKRAIHTEMVPEFANRLQQAITAAEQATGQKATITSLTRTNDEQKGAYANSKIGGGLAAVPKGMRRADGTISQGSRHERGMAADIARGPVLDWLHQHAGEFGLEFLKGDAFAKDPVHIQMKLDGKTPVQSVAVADAGGSRSGVPVFATGWRDQYVANLTATPSFQRLTYGEQQDALHSLNAKLDNFENDHKRDEELRYTRAVVDDIASRYPLPQDRDVAEKELRKRIEDPTQLENGTNMLDAQLKTNAQDRAADQAALYQKVFTDVAAAVASNDPEKALAAIPAQGLDAGDVSKLRKFIREKGGPRTDNQWVVDELTALAYGDDAAKAKFKSLPLIKYRTELSDETFQKLYSEQQKLNTSENPTLTSFEKSKPLLTPRLQEIGVNLKETADPSEVAVRNRIFTLAQRNYDAAVAQKGKELTPEEATKVFDETFMQFRDLNKSGYFGGPPLTSIKPVIERFSSMEDDLGMLPGQLLNQAYADIQNSIAAARQKLSADLGMARDDFKSNRIRAQLKKLDKTSVDASMLDQWLTRYQPQ